VRIVVKSCAAHADREFAQFCTWADIQPEVYFADGEILGCPDDYEHLPRKTKAICKLTEDYLFLCDTDTYVHVPRLLASGYEAHNYIGYQLTRNSGIPYASGGAGYWLSKAAMEVIAKSANPDLFENEDEMVGNVLFNAGIKLHHDPRYALYEDVLPGNNIISRHLSSRGPYEISFMYAAHRRANP
jgi:hypothetical protein